MASKDDRSKDKRRKMKQYTSGHHQKNKNSPRINNTSTSTSNNNNRNTSCNSPHGVHSIVDVADSSDEPRFARGKGWSSGVGAGGGYRQQLVQPNRERYDLKHLDDIDDNDGEDALHDKKNSQLCAGNFQQMATNTSLGGNHFSFEEEKQWSGNIQKGEQQQKVLESNEYFTLNIAMLTAGLKTIPFYKRLDYSPSLFTRDQINEMNSSAEIAEKHFQQNYIINRPTIKVNSAKKEVPVPVPVEDVVKDELDELLDITAKASDENPVPAPAGKQPNVDDKEKIAVGDNPDEVEDWLNSVLE